MGTKTTATERTAKIGELRAERAKLWLYDELTGAQERRLAEIEGELYTLERDDYDERAAALRQRIAAGGTTVAGGTDDYDAPPKPGRRSQVFTGDPWERAGTRPGAPAAELRGQALTAVERCAEMPDAARQRVTVDLEDDDDNDARLARAVVELSQPAYRSAFVRWLRDPMTGHYEWDGAERAAVRRVRDAARAMSLGVDTAGGFLVPFELDPQVIIGSAGAVDPMRSVARVVTTARDEKRFITSAGMTAEWAAEFQEANDNSPVLAQPPVAVHKAHSFVPFSIELGEDSDLLQQLGVLFADAKANLESAAFTLGTGAGQPRGVVTAVAATPGSVIATGTNALSAADVYANQAALPARWRPNARFMANLSAVNGYRQLIKAPGMTESLVDDAGPRPRIAGWEVVENSAMDGAPNATANDYLLLSGDFRQYAIVDRIGTTVEVIPHLFGPTRRMPTGQRGAYMHWRTGGDVLVPDAFRLTNYNG